MFPVGRQLQGNEHPLVLGSFTSQLVEVADGTTCVCPMLQAAHVTASQYRNAQVSSNS